MFLGYGFDTRYYGELIANSRIANISKIHKFKIHPWTLILPGVTNCFAVFIKFQAFVVIKLHPALCQDPVQYYYLFKQPNVLIKLLICSFFWPFYKGLSFLLWDLVSIKPAACLLTLPAVIPLANRNAGSIVRALWLVKWVYLHLEHTARA